LTGQQKPIGLGKKKRARLEEYLKRDNSHYLRKSFLINQ